MKHSTTLEEFRDWRKNPVTQEVMEVIRERINDSKNALVVGTNDREYDLFVKGMIKAFNEVLEMKFSEGEQDEDEIQPE